MVTKRVVLGILAIVFAYYFGKSRNVPKLEGRVIQTTSGSVKGIVSLSREGQEFYEWLGIPYGTAERFASAKPIEKWSGVLDASEYGPVCAQLDLFTETFIGEENCLYLNVHVPKSIEQLDKPVPVMFWIHGGYFYAGSSNQYRPDYFMDEKVILVTINYRLGSLGFLNTGDNVVRGNMGLKDQALALKWTKENIAKFGGDDKNIVLFGESAGGASSHFHMFSSMSKGLMSKVISQSGTSLNPWAMNNNPKAQSQEFAQKFNCPTTDSKSLVACLRKVNLYDLVEGQRPALDLFRVKSKIFVPTVETIIDDQTFLADHPRNLMKSGKFEQLPWMTGAMSSEGLIFSHVFLKNESFRSQIQENWPEFAESFLNLPRSEVVKNGQKIRDFYFGPNGRLDNMEAFDQVTNSIGDSMFTFPGIRAAVNQAKNGLAAPVYLYYYDKAGPSLLKILMSIEKKLPLVIEVLIGLAKAWVNTNIFGIPPKHYGACHGDDLVMQFHIPQIFHVGKDHENFQFSKDFVKLWVDFAYDHKTMKFRHQNFPKMNPKSRDLKFFEIDDIPSMKPLNERVKGAYEFWDSIM